MMGFVYKDVLILRKQLTYYLVFLVIYGALSALGALPYSVLAGLVVLIPLIVPMSCFSYDDLAHWDKFAAATPAGRRGVVTGRYVFFLLTLAASAVVVIAMLLLLGAAGLIELTDWWEPVLVVLTCASVTMILDGIAFPILFKFGAEKARTISLVLFAAIFGGCMLIGFLSVGPSGEVGLPGWLDILLTWLPLLAVLLGVAVLAVSYVLSLRIYTRKEL